MKVTLVLFSVTYFLTTLLQVRCESYSFRSTFLTPKDEKPQRNFDDLEILERSNFPSDESDAPEAAKNYRIENNPQATANAQIHVRFSDKPSFSPTKAIEDASFNEAMRKLIVLFLNSLLPSLTMSNDAPEKPAPFPLVDSQEGGEQEEESITIAPITYNEEEEQSLKVLAQKKPPKKYEPEMAKEIITGATTEDFNAPGARLENRYESQEPAQENSLPREAKVIIEPLNNEPPQAYQAFPAEVVNDVQTDNSAVRRIEFDAKITDPSEEAEEEDDQQEFNNAPEETDQILQENEEVITSAPTTTLENRPLDLKFYDYLRGLKNIVPQETTPREPTVQIRKIHIFPISFLKPQTEERPQISVYRIAHQKQICNTCNLDNCICSNAIAQPTMYTSYNSPQICNYCNSNPCSCTSVVPYNMQNYMCNSVQQPQLCYNCNSSPCSCTQISYPICSTCNVQNCICNYPTSVCNTCNMSPCSCIISNPVPICSACNLQNSICNQVSQLCNSCNSIQSICNVCNSPQCVCDQQYTSRQSYYPIVYKFHSSNNNQNGDYSPFSQARSWTPYKQEPMRRRVNVRVIPIYTL